MATSVQSPQLAIALIDDACLLAMSFVDAWRGARHVFYLSTFQKNFVSGADVIETLQTDYFARRMRKHVRVFRHARQRRA